MTETLSYDPTPADQPEFSAEEQDSLRVAEELGEKESELYAGKFENAEELENAYLNLQKKLGSDDEDVEIDTEELDYPDEVVDSVSVMMDASEEYYANDGQLSEETMERFSEMSSRDLVDAYVAMYERGDVSQASESRDLTDSEMNTVYNSVGGEAEYTRLTGWAAENLESRALDAFNNIVDQGNPTAIQIAVAGLRSEYESQEGYEGRMLSGKAAQSRDSFRSQAEVVQAMNDPRYDQDPAYRQDIYDKLERSNVQF
jgi:hypothetical protein